MPSKRLRNTCLDARPDRIDYRDRLYLPPLRSLPERHPDAGFIEQHLGDYVGKDLVLDQENEGACTGFGLAAVINYLLWYGAFRGERPPERVERVSMRMLYHMARVYDEWPGEDYEGSSCRGAMKGWHKHGVCTDTQWPYKHRGKIAFRPPKQGWEQDAARRPLGSYYRVRKDSILEMQAAIHEVGAIYASAEVHDGWFLDEAPELPVIEIVESETGGHAFALVGYTSEGFIVQNSWGPKWGYKGFAIMTYEDWIQHGTDAWVAVLGAPMIVTERVQRRTRSRASLRDATDGKAAWFWSSKKASRRPTYQNPAVEPLSENDAYLHTVVFGNDGRPLNRFLDRESAADAVRETAYDLPSEWLAAQGTKKLAIYAHGGLNDEAASIDRIRSMAPYFRENGIYPLFLTWRTGVYESICGLLDDVVARFFSPRGVEPSRGVLEDVGQQIQEARDRSIEVASEHLLVKAVWEQMKQNALASSSTGAGLHLLVRHLAKLASEINGLEVHLIGHSAGSILHGHLLDLLGRRKLKVKSCTMYAPACTVRFALDHYASAVQASKILRKEALHFDILSDERERADSVGAYGKSLLYLVSRALEREHKEPILGMQGAWTHLAGKQDLWSSGGGDSVRAWRAFAGQKVSLRVHDKNREQVSTGRGKIRLAHGSFDNDVEVVTETLERIVGGPLHAKVESLAGF